MRDISNNLGSWPQLQISPACEFYELFGDVRYGTTVGDLRGDLANDDIGAKRRGGTGEYVNHCGSQRQVWAQAEVSYPSSVDVLFSASGTVTMGLKKG